jgi:hypothetical protein
MTRMIDCVYCCCYEAGLMMDGATG